MKNKKENADMKTLILAVSPLAAVGLSAAWALATERYGAFEPLFWAAAASGAFCLSVLAIDLLRNR